MKPRLPMFADVLLGIGIGASIFSAVTVFLLVCRLVAPNLLDIGREVWRILVYAWTGYAP